MWSEKIWSNSRNIVKKADLTLKNYILNDAIMLIVALIDNIHLNSNSLSLKTTGFILYIIVSFCNEIIATVISTVLFL